MGKFTVDIDHPVSIPSENAQLEGLLHIPQSASGIVIFAHGSGSGRFSPRNQFIARELQRIKIATMLFDLLTVEEDEIDSITSQYRFDIKFLAERLVTVTHWVMKNPVLNQLPVGYFGASTGGGAALAAAATLTNSINAIVSRGGRPDLAGDSLADVKAPTLLIIGGNDEKVIQLNRQAFDILHCEKKMEIVSGATHLFEEPGKLEEVSRLANNWFERYL